MSSLCRVKRDKKKHSVPDLRTGIEIPPIPVVPEHKKPSIPICLLRKAPWLSSVPCSVCAHLLKEGPAY